MCTAEHRWYFERSGDIMGTPSPIAHSWVEFTRDWPASKVTSSSYGEYRNSFLYGGRRRNEKPPRPEASNFQIQKPKKTNEISDERLSRESSVVRFPNCRPGLFFNKKKKRNLQKNSDRCRWHLFFFFKLLRREGTADICPLPRRVTRPSSQSASSGRKRHSYGAAHLPDPSS